MTSNARDRDATFPPGLERILNSLDGTITRLDEKFDRLDEKVDAYVTQTVTKEEFRLFQRHEAAAEQRQSEMRRSNMRYFLTTIIAVFALLAAWATVIIMTREPAVVIDPTTMLGYFL